MSELQSVLQPLNPNPDCWTQVIEKETMGAGGSLGYMDTYSTNDRSLEVLWDLRQPLRLLTFVDTRKGYVDKGTCPSFSSCHSASYFPAYDAQPYARVPQCALHLRVCIPPAFPLHALGKVNPSLPGTWVSGLYSWVSLSSGILPSRNGQQGLWGPFQCDCSNLPYSEIKILLM